VRKWLPLALLPAFMAVQASNGIFRNGFELPGYCPSGRVTSTVVSWRYDGNGRRLMDVTNGDNVWGRWEATQPAIGFPWHNVFALFWALPRAGYVAAGLKTPTDLTLSAYGILNHGATSGGPPIDMAISDWCGDFNPPGAWCSASNVGTGQNIIAWKFPEFTGPALCELQPGMSYFLNLRVHDPAIVHDDCGGSACRLNIQNNRNP
jgi:hypothetical protein